MCNFCIDARDYKLENYNNFCSFCFDLFYMCACVNSHSIQYRIFIRKINIGKKRKTTYCIVLFIFFSHPNP